VPAAGLVWLGWTLVAQDQELAEKQLTDRLGDAADDLVRRMARDLDGLDPGSAVPEPDAGPLVVTLSSAGVVSRRGAPLVFVPVQPAPVEPRPSMWTEAQAAEDRGDRVRAEAAYQRLARSSDPAVRAGALVRLARVQRNSGNTDRALDAYAAMDQMDDVAVFGDPASLVAAQARIRTLAAAGRTKEAENERASLRADLLAGRWAVDRVTFETALTEENAGAPGPDFDEAVALASAVEAIWSDWRSRPDGEEAEAGRRVVTVSDQSVLAIWAPGPSGLAVLVATPRFMAGRWRGLTDDGRVAVAIDDANGHAWLGGGTLAEPVVTRATADSALPWVVRVASTAPGDDIAAIAGRRQQLLLLPLAAFVMMAGAYFVARAVRRELAAAELQSNFVSAVSHEFRTPLTSISHLVELLRDRPDMDASRRARYYDALEQEAARLRRFVDQLLDFGRADAGAARYRLEPANPSDLVDTIVDRFRDSPAARGHVISSQAAAGLPDLRVDADSIALALNNLLENAAKYSPADGPIEVGLETDASRRRVSIHVRDRGAGIPKAEHDAIFERFVRGRGAETSGVRGTGVGLALAREIVRAHGGDIRVESEPGAGSTFTIELPAAEAALGAVGGAGFSRPEQGGLKPAPPGT
jgi:signal transduction histidine kinase